MTRDCQAAWDAVPVGAVVQEKWSGRLWTSWRVNSRDGSFIVDDEGNWRTVDRSYDGRVRGSWPWESSSATSDFVVIGVIDLTLTDDEIRAAYNRLVARDRG